MVYKPSLAKSRGSAGESAMSPRRGYNFANMYATNKTDEARNEVQGLGNRLEQTRSATDRLAQQGREAASRGQDPSQYTNDIAGQVAKAQGLSNTAKTYNVGANAMKGGQSGFQAGITSFYAGGQGAQNQARKFGGIYDQVRNSAGMYNSGIGGIYDQGKKDVDLRQRAETERINKQHQAEMDAAQGRLDNKNWRSQNTAGGQELSYSSDLDWMYKTGRITNDERMKALKDKEYYNTLMSRYS